ncbi:MAG TPA: hypothetical protein DCS93_19045 [Microscillaceae bacterium]|nr:hypothetical protein [Microscillaceae bacterium]
MNEQEHLDRLRHHNAVQAFMEEDSQDWVAQSDQRWDNYIQQKLIDEEATTTPLQMFVAPGESLGSVVQKYEVSLTSLSHYNQIQDPAQLFTEDTLINVPTVFHQASSHDTWEGVAQQYEVDVAQLKEWNDHPLQLFEGDTVKIPDKSGHPTAQGKLPEPLKSNMEQLGGVSLDDVKVHYNSDKPDQLTQENANPQQPVQRKAAAYAQGTDIYLAPGQEQHLAHEAWHTVQQKQGRVQANAQAKNGIGINNDPALEKEADDMGAKAEAMGPSKSGASSSSSSTTTTSSPSGEKTVQTKCTACAGGVNKNKKTAQLKVLGDSDHHSAPCPHCGFEGVQPVQAKFTTDIAPVAQLQEITCEGGSNTNPTTTANEGDQQLGNNTPNSESGTPTPQSQEQGNQGETSSQKPQTGSQPKEKTNESSLQNNPQNEDPTAKEKSKDGSPQTKGEKNTGKEKSEGPQGKAKKGNQKPKDEKGNEGSGNGTDASNKATEYTKSTPTQMGQQHASIGAEIKTAANQDMTRIQGELTPRTARLSGAPKPGSEEFALQNAQITNPQENLGSEPKAPEAETHEHNTNEPPKPELPDDAEEEGGFFSRLFDALSDFLDSIRGMLVNIPVQDPGVSTSAGNSPSIQLQGTANPDRADHQVTQRNTEVEDEQTRVTEAIRNHPGPENVQPLEIDTPFEVPQLQTEIPDVNMVMDENIDRYVNAEMPPEVRQLADADLDAVLQPHLEGPRANLEGEVNTQQQLRTQTMDENDRQLQELNQQVQKDQESKVNTARQNMRGEMRRGEEESQRLTAEFKTETDTQRTTLHGQLEERVQQDNVAARGKLQDAACEAERHQAEAERKAQEERARAEKEAESQDEGIFDAIGDFMSDLWDAVTEAIDGFFEEARRLISETIEAAQNAAVSLIEAGRQWVVDQIDGFRDWLKDKVTTFLADKFPALAETINQAIDAVADAAIEEVNQMAEDLKKGVEELAKQLSEAIDNILSAIQEGINTFVDIVGAILSGDFAKAMEIAFMALCKAAGINPDEVMEFINKVGDLIMTIFNDPKTFLMNVLDTATLGLSNFVTNILSHLGKGLMTWLMGPLGKLNITLPEKFDLQGIFSLTMQVLGLTYQNIRTRAVDRLEKDYPGKGEQIVGTLETTAGIVMDVFQNGPIALWEHFQEFVGDLKQTVMDGIQSFVVEQLVRSGIDILLKMTNPIGGVIKILETVYDFIMFIRDNWERIFKFAQTVYDTVADIAAGNIAGAAAMLENALAQTIPMILDFLAKLLNFDGIVDKIQDIMKKIQAPINQGIDKVLDMIVKAAQRVIRGITGKGDEDDKKKGDESPEARKKGAKEKLVKLMKAKKNMSQQEMNNTLVDLKAEFKLSKVQIEDMKTAPKVAFYASPATYLPVAAKIKDGQKANTQNQQSVKNGDYIKATNYDGAFPSPGKELVNHFNRQFAGKRTTVDNGTPPVAKTKNNNGTVNLYAIQPIAGNVLGLETSSKGASYLRAGEVIAKSSVRRGPKRSDTTRKETVFGHFGVDEEKILKGDSVAYNGGHLVGDQIMDSHRAFNLYEDWNLAPQNRSFNSPNYTSAIENVVTNAIKSGATVEYNVKVQYPDNTYNIKPSVAIQNVLPSANNLYRQQIEGAIQHDSALDANFALHRRVPGYWQAQAKVVGGSGTLNSGNITARNNVAFENNPTNLDPSRPYNPANPEAVRYSLQIAQGQGQPLTAIQNGPTSGNPISYSGATTVVETARQQTF